METFPMSVKEISRISIFERLRDRNIKQKEASMILGVINQTNKKETQGIPPPRAASPNP